MTLSMGCLLCLGQNGAKIDVAPSSHTNTFRTHTKMDR